MAEVKACPKCGTENDKNFFICKKCGMSLDGVVPCEEGTCSVTAQTQETASTHATTESLRADILYKKKVKQYVEQGKELSEAEEAALFAECVELQLLKAPATAIFPDFDEMVIQGQNGHYSVSAFVDAQNSNGAMIRTNYTLTVEKNGEQWSCADKFVDSSSVINKEINESMAANTILYWILGIIGTAITYFIIRASIW